MASPTKCNSAPCLGHLIVRGVANPRPSATIRDRKLHFFDIAMTDFNEKCDQNEIGPALTASCSRP